METLALEHVPRDAAAATPPPYLRRLDADAVEKLGIRQRQLNDFAQLSNLLVQATDVGEGHLRVLLSGRVVFRVFRVCDHRVDGRIHLPRQLAHDRESGHVQRHSRAGLELRLVQAVPAADYVSGSVAGLHDELLFVQLLQNLSDDLPDALERLQVVFGLLVLLAQLSDLPEFAVKVR
eukprot:scaffold2350_cov259-Pinguiococcus_pyrenoidosus.AAC.4